MKKNFITATLIGVGIVLWLASGLFASDDSQDKSADAQTLIASADEAVRVRVAQFNAEQRTLTRILRGKTASKRTAQVSAEIVGRVIKRPVERGDRVLAGDLLCELALDDRAAIVKEAQANLSQAEIEYRGALELKDRNLLSEIRIAQVGAQLESARANLAKQQLNLTRTKIVAPFDGVVENLHMDVGDFATAGSPCATLIDLDPLLISANVSEQDVQLIDVGRPVSARTSTDQRLEGIVTFVGSQSENTTRTYPVEITVPNEDYSVRAGLTTIVSVEANTVLAHRVSTSLLTLDDAGIIGLRAVDQNNRVIFHPVTIVEDAVNGAWVTGLPGVVRLITVGQEYVAAGEIVEVEDTALPPATASRS